MRAGASRLRRNLFVALLVMITLLPLVVFVYSHQQARVEAARRLTEHLERSIGRAIQIKRDLEPVIERSGPRSPSVRLAMERLVASDETIAYLQLADRSAQVLNSTGGAPQRAAAPLEALPPASPELAAPEVIRALRAGGASSPPEYVIDLWPPKSEPVRLLVGVSTQILDEQLRQFQEPMRWSAVQIAVICVAILAIFSAYIVFLHERDRKLNAQLQEESRLAYVGTLAAGIAHEVRNPLSSVKINVQMMESHLKEMRDPADAEYFRTKIARIRGEIERLEDSVNNFLAFSRPAPLQPARVRLNDLVAQVLEVLQPQCDAHGIQLVRRFARDLPPVDLDPRQFIQAVQNLVINAIQALERGGTITVTTEATGAGVALSVADNGPGIPLEIQGRIFEVFFTTREKGTGLGLNIVSRIVEEHRGKLTLASEPGKGATFRIELPAAKECPNA